MTAHDRPDRPADATDAQLITLARYIARLTVEVEAGLRPPDHLTSLMDPPTASRWRQHPELIGRFRAGPVQPGDIGPPHLDRRTPTDVYATVTTRTQPGRWGALTFRLRADDQRWWLTDLQRILAAAHYHNRPARQGPAEPIPPARRLAQTAADRRLVTAALGATRQRLTELDRTDPGYRATAQMVRVWQQERTSLDRELDRLQKRPLTRGPAATSRSRWGW